MGQNDGTLRIDGELHHLHQDRIDLLSAIQYGWKYVTLPTTLWPSDGRFGDLLGTDKYLHQAENLKALHRRNESPISHHLILALRHGYNHLQHLLLVDILLQGILQGAPLPKYVEHLQQPFNLLILTRIIEFYPYLINLSSSSFKPQDSSISVFSVEDAFYDDIIVNGLSSYEERFFLNKGFLN